MKEEEEDRIVLHSCTLCIGSDEIGPNIVKNPTNIGPENLNVFNLEPNQKQTWGP